MLISCELGQYLDSGCINTICARPTLANRRFWQYSPLYELREKIRRNLENSSLNTLSTEVLKTNLRTVFVTLEHCADELFVLNKAAHPFLKKKTQVRRNRSRNLLLLSVTRLGERRRCNKRKRRHGWPPETNAEYLALECKHSRVLTISNI